MIFKRRQKRSFIRKIRDFFVPRKGWWRGFEYIGQRVKRLQGTPHSIALGFACGVFASFTPFFGVHFVLAAMLAWMFRANILASAFGTAVGNPLTFPLIATMSLKIGDWVLYSADLSQERPFEMSTVFEEHSYFWQEILLPYLVGGTLPGFFFATAAYFALGGVLRSYRLRKRARLKRAAAKRLKVYKKAYNIGQHKNSSTQQKSPASLDDTPEPSNFVSKNM